MRKRWNTHTLVKDVASVLHTICVLVNYIGNVKFYKPETPSYRSVIWYTGAWIKFWRLQSGVLLITFSQHNSDSMEILFCCNSVPGLNELDGASNHRFSIVCSAVCLGADQREHQSSASLAFERGNHRWPVNSPHKGPVTRSMFPFDDVIMYRVTRNI